MALTFRRADPDDRDELVGLVESAYRGDVSRQGWTTEADLIDGQRVDATMMTSLLAGSAVRVLVGLDDGLIVACCELRPTADGAALGMFAVSPSRQGDGVGRRMLAEAERVVRAEWGALHLTMTVIDVRVELLEWYRRRGYEPTGELRPFPYGDDRFGRPRRDDLRFAVLSKDLAAPIADD